MQKILIFFSWQSERLDSSNLIRDMLNECAEGLSEKLKIKFEVKDADADNRGSYNINDAVHNAIKNCNLTVADLTPTSHGNDGRANPNANALYEYAMARSIKGDERVLAVADISLDSIKTFPFDFNHNAIVTFNSRKDDSFKISFKKALEKIVESMLYPVVYDSTTVFFSKRIAQGFPGVWGLRVYEDKNEINLHLDSFFKHPIVFGEALDREGDRNPLWWFRGGQAENIDSYERQQNGVVILGWNELKIRKVAVYSDSSRYYSEYLYIEAEGMPSIYPNSLSQEEIRRIVDDMGFCDEEYAIVHEGGFSHNISRHEYDDGYAEMDGRIIPIRDKAKLRCRYLSPVNFLVAAKFGSYNCNEFCRTSKEYFDGLLKGTVSLDQFHDYLMKFPKPEYR